MSKEMKLRRCPFCGGKARLTHDTYCNGTLNKLYSKIICTDCSAQGAIAAESVSYCADDAAAEAWNSRSGLEDDWT